MKNNLNDFRVSLIFIFICTSLSFTTLSTSWSSFTALVNLVLLFSNNRLQTYSRDDMKDKVDYVEPEELSLFARLVGEDTQARVIESISTWANDKAKENPGCVERFVCETYKTGETMSGIPYLMMSLTK